MPQMAPMNWFFLYVLFIIIFILFMTKNYYFLMNNFKSMNYLSKKFNKNSWKW
uniref:ATP synthase F0 subunit 8 n=1 Tax=Sininocellia chikun TaxID=3018585 RepID=UPI0022FD78D8|nr:ATP synthase F0 subunit 8 [Sininocellia chikun]WBK02696.1 ATP synthase F0 subunit 8 [Sininocellia chikun]